MERIKYFVADYPMAALIVGVVLLFLLYQAQRRPR